LFSTYQQLGRSDDPSERVKAASVYFEAVAPFETADIEAAVSNFLNGSAPGVNPNFAPPAPAVASEVRRCMNQRLDSEHRRRPPALPAPDVVRTPESMARVAAATKRAVENLASAMLTVDAADAKRRQKFQGRVHERFDPQTEREVAERLGYTVGDPDADEGDWGGRAA
jgi:hypothetical protein